MYVVYLVKGEKEEGKKNTKLNSNEILQILNIENKNSFQKRITGFCSGQGVNLMTFRFVIV